MATSSRQQPPWQPPPQPSPECQLPPLKIWNSLTRSKNLFVPIDSKNKTITWYVCGPTVYNDAHLGHARNYATTDIIRRILQDYFKYKVKFVMNITDVDDKIIIRGRQQHLLDEFRAKRLGITASLDQYSKAALRAYLKKNLPLIPENTIPADVMSQARIHYATVLQNQPLGSGTISDSEAKTKMHINTVDAASKAIFSMSTASDSTDNLDENIEDILLPYLDSLYGDSIDAKDHAIFTKLTKRYENRFMEDLQALNCLDPDEITRVTEYGPQIVDFVEKIQKNEFAYMTSDGSVYFDITAFEAANNSYARLEPWNRNDAQLQADGEGSLSKKTSEKKSEADFALWKASKPGEPSWPSPWGEGRPGWHIECSAMASDKLGRQIDIHSGGIDLAFPHHDNELAQSEAYWLDKSHQSQHQWVNYFMHMGHLSIKGSKMSKSLKNFTTIRDALNRGDWTSRGLRILFLLGNWKDGIEITDDLIKEGSAWEEKLNNFFFKAKETNEKQESGSSTATSENEVDRRLGQDLEKATKDTFEALCDSFNTSAVMAIIAELVSSYHSTEKAMISVDTTQAIARWITSMVNTFGLNGAALSNDQTIGWSGIDIPAIAKPYLYPLSRLRDDLRRKAREVDGLTREEVEMIGVNAIDLPAKQQPGAERYATLVSHFQDGIRSLQDSKSLSKDVLELCDRLRDVELWDLGIYLEDRDGNQPALVRPVTKELLQARKDKEERERQKVQAKEEREREAAAKVEKGRLSHLEMFRTHEYSAWDPEGIPVKDAEGEEMTKSKAKKLRKDWERQKKLHEAWTKSNIA